MEPIVVGGVVAGGVVGGMGAVIAVEAGVAAVGFTASGIAAGSTAAAMMSTAAVANGGAVAAGSTVAVLQSVGAAGLGSLAGPVIVVGAVLGAAVIGFSAYCIAGNIKPLPGKACRGVHKDHWMVVTEEGIWNVFFYPFPTESQARQFFDSVHKQRTYLARILYDAAGREVEAGGWISWALTTIRENHCGPVDKCGGLVVSGAFAPGDVIALFSPSRMRFLRMQGEAVEGHGERGVEELAAGWSGQDAELFTVVDASEGEFALHSKCCNRFVRLLGGDVDARGGVKSANELPKQWDSERFTLVDAGDGLVALHSRSHNRYLRLDGSNRANAKGGPRDRDALPDGWQDERFRLMNLTRLAPPLVIQGEGDQ